MAKKQNLTKGSIEKIYGVHPVIEVLTQKNRKITDLFLLANELKVWQQIQFLLPNYPYNIHRLSRAELSDRLETTDHQGIGVFALPFPFRKKFFDPAKDKFLVMLDGMQDVRNIGAIIRTAYCVGVDGIIIVSHHGALLNGAALKASAGLAERMSIYHATSSSSVLQDLKQHGYAIYVAALSKQANAYDVAYKKPLCLIIGSEGVGVSAQSLKSGTIITLPQKSPEISFNASVAAGILMSIIQKELGV